MPCQNAAVWLSKAIWLCKWDQARLGTEIFIEIPWEGLRLRYEKVDMYSTGGVWFWSFLSWVLSLHKTKSSHSVSASILGSMEILVSGKLHAHIEAFVLRRAVSFCPSVLSHCTTPSQRTVDIDNMKLIRSHQSKVHSITSIWSLGGCIRFKYMFNVSIREYFSVSNMFFVCIRNTAMFKIIPLLCTHVHVCYNAPPEYEVNSITSN